MADTSEKRLQGGELGETQCGETETYDTTAKRSNDGWPARPGQTQYEWEEPRVVVNSTGKRLEGSGGQSLQGANERLTITDRETSESGGTKEEDRGPSGEGVVGDTKFTRLRKKTKVGSGLEASKPIKKYRQGEARWKVEPQLGRTVDGTSSGVDSTANRVDRLRLLGNGVVPQTCERALRVLMERLHAK